MCQLPDTVRVPVPVPCPERITFILATALWISGSVLMYYAERDNPDEGSHAASRCTFLAGWVLCTGRTCEVLGITSAPSLFPSG